LNTPGQEQDSNSQLIRQVVVNSNTITTTLLTYEYETGTAMNARASENYLAISRSSSASKSVEIFWADIYWGRLFLGPNLVSFNRAVFPYDISKVNFRVETKILVSMSEEI
jgi:hypothetical protein